MGVLDDIGVLEEGVLSTSAFSGFVNADSYNRPVQFPFLLKKGLIKEEMGEIRASF